jgi:hypothetical protein
VAAPVTSRADDGPSTPVDGRSGLTLEWNGTELFAWGGQDAAGVHVDGGRYDGASGAWSPIPAAPIPPTEGDAGVVVVGESLVVCCGSEPGRGGPAAAVYSSRSGEWRAAATPPVALRYPAAVAVGGRSVFVGDDHLLAYDPVADEWAQLADPPVGMWAPDAAWSGARLYAWSTPSGGANFGAEYDFAADEWSVLPDPPTEAFPTYADIEWMDGRLAVWGVDHRSSRFPGPGAVGVGSIWDPAARNWTPMAQPLPAAVSYDGNAGSQTLHWTGGRLLVHTGSLASGLAPGSAWLLAYDPARDEWRRLTEQFAESWSTGMVDLGMYGLALMDGGRLRIVDTGGPWESFPTRAPGPSGN